MKHIHSHSRSSLFLMEMILALLFFALACSVCVQILFAAYRERKEARFYNQSQDLLVLSAEALEGWQGEPSDYAAILAYAGLMVQETGQEGELLGYLDRRFSSCSEEEAHYQLSLSLSRENYQKRVQIRLLEKQPDGSFAGTDVDETIAFPWPYPGAGPEKEEGL